ncbi:MAG: 23S rRNA (adenine(1618)-N(6))-methyltransferase [Bacteriovorax sp. MedPE-SWde]|nr:MAG: 23S rRNA (adenine(1618)-N(6))-methyltransferase [Bacteriovorax sp. MedPE-SWde]
MTQNKSKGLHPRNLHSKNYDFDQLIKALPELEKHIIRNSYGGVSIDFSRPESVLVLNKALLKRHYGIKSWGIPKGKLCPPIPGRADYIHHIADLLSESNKSEIPKSLNIRGLDIGTGANCIYPLIANKVYSWRMTGSELNDESYNSAKSNIKSNELESYIECRKQINPQHIFQGIICPEDRFDFTMCNPPFHASRDEATQGSRRKVTNLSKNKNQGPKSPVLNFGGQDSELWCEGGELKFITQMIQESLIYKDQCLWFTTLVSKKENLKPLNEVLKNVKTKHIRVIEMKQGNKITRVLVWTYLKKGDRIKWMLDKN